MPEDLRSHPSRRRFLELGAAGVAVAAVSVVGAGEADAATARFTEAQAAMLLRVARVGAVFPVPFPGFGEKGPAVRRATKRRLVAAQHRASAHRLALAHGGAVDLIRAHLAGAGQPALLDGLGRLAGTGNAQHRKRLHAVVALAIATVSTHFDPNSDAGAKAWLGGLRIMHERGELVGLAKERGLR